MMMMIMIMMLDDPACSPDSIVPKRFTAFWLAYLSCPRKKSLLLMLKYSHWLKHEFCVPHLALERNHSS